MGNIGRFHAGYLLKGQVPRAELTAVCNSDSAALESYKPLAIFDDGQDLIRSGTVDAVIISTPHTMHASLGIAALENGIHVMVEKPIASHKIDAERLVEAHAKCRGTVFAGMFQQRTEPRYRKIRQFIQEDLGELVRMTWINTDWFRTEAYYNSSEWRATWSGEGGGILINQCLHNLDMLQWLCGMPTRLRGFCQFGRFHDIEVEDNVTAYMEWPCGATGTFIGSSGEAPGSNRLEIAGKKGSLVLEGDRILLSRLKEETTEFSRKATQGFVKPDSILEEISADAAPHPHALVTNNFIDAILDGVPLIAPGSEGVHSVELANAITYSSLLSGTLELPMDGHLWEKKLEELTAQSSRVKKVTKVPTDDFTSSFRK